MAFIIPRLKKQTTMNKLFNEPNNAIKCLGELYKQSNGVGIKNGECIKTIDTRYCMYIADAFERMKHEPNDEYVKLTYELFIEQTVKQYEFLYVNGYRVELFTGKGEPYKNSDLMRWNVKHCMELKILSTVKEFGNKAITQEQINDNPMLADSGKTDINGKPLLINDLFRFVHDIFGHCERGNGFGPIGELNAYDCHMRLYSSVAQYALTSETLGQNCWVNFGPHMRNAAGELIKESEAGYLKPNERPFAPQKVGLLGISINTHYKL